MSTKNLTPDEQRLMDYSNEARKWLASFRRLVTQKRNGSKVPGFKVSEAAISNSANEFYFAARNAARVALKGKREL